MTIIKLPTIDPMITVTGAAKSQPEGSVLEPGEPGSVDPTEPEGAVACTEVLDQTPPDVEGLVAGSNGVAPEEFVGLPPEPVVVVVDVPVLGVGLGPISLEEVVVSPPPEELGESVAVGLTVGFVVVVGSKSSGGVLEMIRRRASSPDMLRRKAFVVVGGCRFIILLLLLLSGGMGKCARQTSTF